MTDEVKQRKIEHVNIALGQDISVAQRLIGTMSNLYTRHCQR